MARADYLRSPRVQIKYEADFGHGPETVELPFVVGVLGDYSGKPAGPVEKLKNRKFVEVTANTFDHFTRSLSARLAFQVADKISGRPNSQLGVELRFSTLEDFSPERIVPQVEPLRKLLDVRWRLAELKNKMQGNEQLGQLLSQILKNPSLQQDINRNLNESPVADVTTQPDS